MVQKEAVIAKFEVVFKHLIGGTEDNHKNPWSE
jgi:hypothetical protein